jgi:DNA (cytosine-5)-methyltransferase 1
MGGFHRKAGGFVELIDIKKKYGKGIGSGVFFIGGQMLKVIEAFAGIGSQTQALKNLGIEHEVVAISEIDKYALLSYEALHGKPNNLGDIARIEELPAADLWTYSSPCTDVSQAGQMKGLTKGGGTRSGLLWEIERLLLRAMENGTLPKYLLFENVKNIVGKRFKADFEKWLGFLSSLGYTNYWKVLNAKYYGIPQNRERVFCISIRGEHTPYVFPEKRELRLRLKDMLDEVVEERYYLKDSTVRAMMNSAYHQRRDSIRNGDDVVNTLMARDFKGPQCVQVGELSGEKWDKMHEQSRRVYEANGMSPTLHCACGGNTEIKIMTEGSYVPSGHNAARVVNCDGLAPTVMENHGTVAAVKIVDDSYKSREPREYGEAAPTIRSGRHGYKVVAGQLQPKDRDYNRKGMLREEQFECRRDDLANAVLTGDKKNCVQIAVTTICLNPKIDGEQPSLPDMVYEEDGRGAAVTSASFFMPKYIAAMRGRNPENPSDRTVGAPTEQRLEPNGKGLCNTLTTVQKDNLVVEAQVLTPKRTEYGKTVRKAYESGAVDESRRHMTELTPREDGVSNTLTTVQKDNLVVTESTFVGRGYKEFIDKNGYMPEMFNPHDRHELTEYAPAITAQCGSKTSSAAVLKAVIGSTQQNAYVGDGSISPTLTEAMGMGGGQVPLIELEEGCGNPHLMKADAEEARTVRCGGHGDLGRHSWDEIEVEEPTMLTPDNWKHKAGEGMATRGRHESAICSALQSQAGHTQRPYVKENAGQVRIRKLTPRECLRLMGWHDEQIDRVIAAGISGTQIYKQAGNGIVVTCLTAILGELFGVPYAEHIDNWRFR